MNRKSFFPGFSLDRRRPLFPAMTVAFLLAILFTVGVESFGHHGDHGHDAASSGRHCIACRILETPASASTANRALAAELEPDPEPLTPEAPSGPFDSSALSTPHLRGPPQS